LKKAAYLGKLSGLILIMLSWRQDVSMGPLVSRSGFIKEIGLINKNYVSAKKVKTQKATERQEDQ